MIVLSWNCQGLGNPRAVQALRRLIVAQGPTVVFLSETRSGGLCLLWKSDCQVAIRSASLHHIDGEVGGIGDTVHWRFTGFYGYPSTADRYKSWQLLRGLATESTLPWICFGDFNELLHSKEKEGGAPRLIRQMLAFRQAISDCALEDSGFEGAEFTWYSTRMGGIKERLDRALANLKWQQLFPASRVVHLDPSRSDHLPFLIYLNQQKNKSGAPSPRFRFEHMWTSHADCESVISSAWATFVDGTPMFQVVEKIKVTRLRLLQWHRSTFKATQRDIQSTRDKLGIIWRQQCTDQTIAAFKALSTQLDELLVREEVYWQQRAKVAWLRDGDRNTRFFHQRANTRKQRNNIQGLIDSNGVWKEEGAAVQEIVVDYFTHLFTSNCRRREDILLNTVDPCVTPTMNASLLTDFTEQEVKHAVFQMYPTKAPGPDGMPPVFFQKYWHIVGNDVSRAIINFLSSGRLLHKINFTHVVLIPKVKNPKDMTQLRPISLCNVLFKIASKVLANRLKTILPSLISPSQSAFVSGRLISDNSILAAEIIHCLRSRRRGKKGFLALKLDMSKAYDRIEWSFLEQMMKKLGFADQWVSLIMTCVTTVTYSFLVNGSSCGYLTPSRGLRQGDPLSPYLFILCAQGFSSFLTQAERDGRLQGVSICRGAPPINHLLFADDCYLFARANVRDCGTIKEALSWYEWVSGQQVNLQKSAICFSKNVKRQDQLDLAASLGVSCADHYDKYLGLPMVVGRNKGSSFAHLKERLGKKLFSWKGKLLSSAGKEILIKTVAQAPLYSMSVYLLPKYFCDDLNRLIADFWWNGNSGDRKIHWLAWDKLCQPKDLGGLGFRDLYAFNLAMLAKQGWRLIQYPNSLIANVLRAKYFHDKSFLEVPVPENSSYVWKSICAARKILLQGSRWQVGSGAEIDIWKDPWVPRPSTFRVISPKPHGCAVTKVNEFILDHPRRWNVSLLSNLLYPPDVDVIRTIPLSFHHRDDALIWHFDKKGQFTVKSAYKVARMVLDPRTVASSSTENGFSKGWTALWKAKIPGKIKLFWWRACNGILPTKDNLWKRKIHLDTCCDLCGAEMESTLHVLWHCPFARGVWACASIGSGGIPRQFHHVHDWVLSCIDHLSHADLDLFFVTGWAIWEARNGKLWNNLTPKPEFTSSSTAVRLHDFVRACPQGAALSRGCTVPQIWIKPCTGSLKINVDGSWTAGNTDGGVGIVVRDSNGKFVVGRALHVDNVFSTLQVEAMAAREGAILAVEGDFNNVIFESDSLQIVSAIRSPSVDRSSVGPVVEDTKALLTQITGDGFTHIRRVANGAAHRLARYASHIGTMATWFEEPPDLLVDILYEECNL
ncbi:hypothetical protein CerSpe_219180 [Prunus speciosa]